MTYECKRDVELVELALPLVGPSVVDVEEDDAGDDPGVHEAGDEEEGHQPVLALGLLVLAHPDLCPGVGKVDDEDELDEDEEEGADEPEVHPHISYIRYRLVKVLGIGLVRKIQRKHGDNEGLDC